MAVRVQSHRFTGGLECARPRRDDFGPPGSSDLENHREVLMSKIVAGITTSVDGYITGPDDGPGCGLGDRKSVV